MEPSVASVASSGQASLERVSGCQPCLRRLRQDGLRGRGGSLCSQASGRAAAPSHCAAMSLLHAAASGLPGSVWHAAGPFTGRCGSAVLPGMTYCPSAPVSAEPGVGRRDLGDHRRRSDGVRTCSSGSEQVPRPVNRARLACGCPVQVSAALGRAGELFMQTYDRVFPAPDPRRQ